MKYLSKKLEFHVMLFHLQKNLLSVLSLVYKGKEIKNEIKKNF